MNIDVTRSIVLITIEDKKNETVTDTGTGFIVYKCQKLNYVVTCSHVVDNCKENQEIKVDNYDARVMVSGGDDWDIAVLEVQASWDDKPALNLGAVNEISHRFSIAGFYEYGSGNMTLRELQCALGDRVKLAPNRGEYRLDAWDLIIEGNSCLEPGYSGSPVFDIVRGYVIGIATLRKGSGKQGLAISIDALKIVWTEQPIGLLGKRESPPPKITFGEACIPYQDHSEDFHGRTKELQQIEELLSKSKTLICWGDPGVGKTFLISQAAKKIGQDQNYKICWIEKEGLTLDELIAKFNEFLKLNGDKVFETIYEKEEDSGLKIPPLNKVCTLLENLNSLQKKYLFVIESFQDTDHRNIKILVDRFRTNGGNHKLLLICHSLERTLGGRLSAKIAQLPVRGFSHDDAISFIDKLGQKIFADQIIFSYVEKETIYQETEGHPLAIELILFWCRKKNTSNAIQDVLKSIVDYDARDEAGLRQKLLEDVAVYLSSEEQEALYRLSVFRTPIREVAREYLEISEHVWNSLLSSWLKSEKFNYFRVHSLIAKFWSKSRPISDMRPWHKRAAEYYKEWGQENSKSILNQDIYDAYLEAYYHWKRIDCYSEAASALNELVHCFHEQERLPGDRLPDSKTTEWLFKLENNILFNNPWLLLEKAKKLEKSGNYKDSQENFRRAYSVFDKRQEVLGICVSSYCLGKGYHLLKDNGQALDNLKLVLKKSKEYSDIPMQIRALGKMISCYADMGKYVDAEELSKKAYKLASTLVDDGEPKDKLGQALILYRQGSIKRRQSIFDEAENLFERSLSLFQELGDIYRQSKALVRIGICQKFQGKLKKAQANIEKAISIKSSINDQHGIARDKDYLADIYRSLGQYQTASSIYQESLEIKEGKTGLKPDPYGKLKAYNNLAFLSLLTGDLDNCNMQIQNFQTLIEEENYKFPGLYGTHLRIKGDLEYLKGDYESALISYEASASYFSPPHPQVYHSYATAILCIGQANLALGKLDLAESKLKDACQRLASHNVNSTGVSALLSLAHLKAIRGDFEVANNLHKTALEISSCLNSNLTLAKCLGTQACLTEIKILSDSNFLENQENNQYTEAVDKKRNKQLQTEASSLIDEVWSQYDQAISIYKKSQVILNIEHLKLKLKKYIWQFTVKYLTGNKIDDDDAYGILAQEGFPKFLIEREIQITNYTLDTLFSLSKPLANSIARVALYVLSPLAMRFGYNSLRETIVEKSFSFLYPEESKKILDWIDSKFPQPQRERIIESIKQDLERNFSSKKLSNIKIEERVKSLFSIYNKIKQRHVSLDKVIDVIGFRIITETEYECYEVLAIIQQLGHTFQDKKVLKENLRDYIQHPKKQTGYQSIHINIECGYPYTQDTQIVEFQIRTHNMHVAAEYGLDFLGLDQLAHCYYKNESRYATASARKNYELDKKEKVTAVLEVPEESIFDISSIIEGSKFSIFSLLDWGKNSRGLVILKLELITKSNNPTLHELETAKEELLNNFKVQNKINFMYSSKINSIDLTREEKTKLVQNFLKFIKLSDKYIYVITPKKDLKKLPENSTCLDYAYRIHEDIGNHCCGAKVNNAMVSLGTTLESGDIVDIITNKNRQTNQDWLDIVYLPKTRSKIEKSLKKLNKPQNISQGHSILQKELSKIGLKLSPNSEVLDKLVDKTNYKNMDDLLEALGYGDFSPNKVINLIKDIIGLDQEILSTTELVKINKGNVTRKCGNSNHNSLVRIHGVDQGVVYRIARCCNPIPNEPIIGVITRDKISVHSQACKNWKDKPSDRQIKVSWDDSHEYRISIDFQITLVDKVGVLKKILVFLEEANINVEGIQMHDETERTKVVKLSVSVPNDVKIQKIFSKIQQMKDCVEISSYNLKHIEG